MEKKKFNLVIDLVMILIIVFVLVIGLVKTLLGTIEINDYENRSAYKITDISAAGLWTGESQDTIELAFADQIPLSIIMKKTYNFLTHAAIDKFYSSYEDNMLKNKYIDLNGIYRMSGTDYLVWKIKNKEDFIASIDSKIANINYICDKYPQIDFYLYYIEKDTDINFETNEKLNMYEYIDDRITEDNITTDKFEINSFDEYKDNFYKTDHHWNYKGSYRAYQNLCKLMGIEDEVKRPLKTFKMNTKFIGSKALTSGLSDLYSEEFEAYAFDIPEHETFVSGEKKEYGRQEECLSNPDIVTSYAHFYGLDNAEVIFDFNKPDRENVLFIGESYDNAILRLMASHFNKTYAIDLRHYENENGKKFSFKEYVENNGIDKVVLIGNIDYYIMSEFNLEE